MTRKIIIIGGGPGGYVCALRSAALGGDVTLIEKENLGGTCLNWGCIPSKIMKNTADTYLKFSKADQYGIKVTGNISIDIQGLNDRKENILTAQRRGIDSLLNSAGIRVVMGEAKIYSSNRVNVRLKDGTNEGFEYDRLVIATGTEPMDVTGVPFDHENILSSNDLLKMTAIPDSMVIVGGGVIGCEFASIFSALGTKVAIIEAMSRLLPMPFVDEDISKNLLREMKKQKIKVICDTIVESSYLKGDKLCIQLAASPFTDNPTPKPLKISEIESQKMAVCIGRHPLSKKLGLGNIDIDTEKGGWIRGNEKMETSTKGVYAIGDILGPQKVMLAHVASHEGMVAAQNAMGLESVMDYHVIPGAVFTTPEIGTVGLSERQAKENGYETDVCSVNFRSLGKAHATGEIAGMAKIILEKSSQKILGVHLIGAHATELIAEATLAIQNELTVQNIAHTIHAHPTMAEIMGELALKAMGTPIHG